METLYRLAASLDAAAAAVDETASGLSRLRPDPAAFGADCPGAAGDLGRSLHASWVAALYAREREAGRVTAQLFDAASAVRGAAGAYAGTDIAVGGRLDRQGP